MCPERHGPYRGRCERRPPGDRAARGPAGRPPGDDGAADAAREGALVRRRVVLRRPLRTRRRRRHGRDGRRPAPALWPGHGVVAVQRGGRAPRLAGTVATVRPGEVNLMTAGRGISHSEVSLPGTTVLHGAQLWLVLPSAAADVEPRFEHFAPPVVPVAEGAGAGVRGVVVRVVVAGAGRVRVGRRRGGAGAGCGGDRAGARRVRAGGARRHRVGDGRRHGRRAVRAGGRAGGAALRVGAARGLGGGGARPPPRW